MIKWTIIVVVALAALVALTALVGTFLPKGHQASRTVVLAASPAAVFSAISDVARYKEWRSDIKSVEVMPDDGKGVLFTEVGTHGPTLFRIEAVEPNSRMLVRIADPTLPYGGTWTYALAPSGSGTALTITEDGEIYNPIFRVMSKVVFSPYATIDAYQAALKKRLGG